MYQLQIWGPKGRRTLRWDPRKIEEGDPKTLAVFAEADRLLHEAFASNKQLREANEPLPRVAASGKWLE